MNSIYRQVKHASVSAIALTTLTAVVRNRLTAVLIRKRHHQETS